MASVVRVSWGILIILFLGGTIARAQDRPDRAFFPPEIIAEDDSLAVQPEATDWIVLEPGLAVAHFDSRLRLRSPAEAADLTVLRLDPAVFTLKMLYAADHDGKAKRDLKDWCAEFDLFAAINAGMYQADGQTHVGFCKRDGRVANGFANDYLSAAAFDPIDAADPPFRIFDLDETPLHEVRARYRNVAQNLRLIKRAGENRWQPSSDQWREAALAEDSRGRILLVFCRTPWSMARFNQVLLGLPLDVVAAQHLDGRHQARLLINHPEYERGPESGIPGPAIPNIFGVVRHGGLD